VAVKRHPFFKTIKMKQRNTSLDALRGFAILTMVLSGSIIYSEIMPAWMFHAQAPPPKHIFDPNIPGITWVDLVFPFFLFSMGAAIPLALNKEVQNKTSLFQITGIAIRRYLLLAFFALFLEHMKAWVQATKPTAIEYSLSIAAFALLFFQLYENKNKAKKKLFIGLKVLAFLLALLLLYFLPFSGHGFMFTKTDIIIIVLANMAFFGTMIWWVTRNQVWLRVGILPLIMGVFLAANNPADGWAKILYQFSNIGTFKFDWLYQFYFLKYLFIIIPGTIAGEWLLKYKNENELPAHNRTNVLMIGLLAFTLVITNTIFLFNRLLFLNLSITLALLLAIYFLIKKVDIKANPLLFHFFQAGAYLLITGLFFEAYEGGIKKDRSTYSYYFVTSGLAFCMLIGLTTMSVTKTGTSLIHYLSINGRNPMVAYVAGSLLLTPLLHLTGAIFIFDSMKQNAWMGFLRGILYTGIVSLITIYFVKRKWFWKT
jgi:predicted acyltransferase